MTVMYDPRFRPQQMPMQEEMPQQMPGQRRGFNQQGRMRMPPGQERHAMKMAMRAQQGGGIPPQTGGPLQSAMEQTAGGMGMQRPMPPGGMQGWGQSGFPGAGGMQGYQRPMNPQTQQAFQQMGQQFRPGDLQGGSRWDPSQWGGIQPQPGGNTGVAGGRQPPPGWQQFSQPMQRPMTPQGVRPMPRPQAPTEPQGLMSAPPNLGGMLRRRY